MDNLSLDEFANTLGQVTLSEVETTALTGAATSGLRQGLVVDGAGDSEVTIKPPEKEADARHRRWLEKVTAIFGMVLFVTAVVIAYQMMFASQNADVQKAGGEVIIGALAAAGGFIAGRNSK